MRYPHGFGLTIPYLEEYRDAEGALVTRANRALIHTNSNVDRRRIKRILRQWTSKQIRRSIPSDDLRRYMRGIIRHTEPRNYFRMPEALDETPDV